MADCASSSRAVIAQRLPSTRPTACSMPLALPVWHAHRHAPVNRSCHLATNANQHRRLVHVWQ
jgi:hypothetical protein